MTASEVLTPERAATLGGVSIKHPGITLQDVGSFWIFYGQGGAGKTTLAASCADSELGRPYLHIDIEGGIDAISHRKDIDYAEIDSWTQFERLTQSLKKADHGYKTICIDNLSELVDVCMAHISGNTDQPEIQEWGQMTREIVFVIREFRQMAKSQGINVIFCAWDADDKDDRGVLKKQLALTPKLQEKVPGIVTVIGHIAVLNDPNLRVLDFAPGPRTVSKFRRSAEANSRKIPFKIQYGLDNLPMPDILAVMRGGKVWPEQKYKVDKRAADTDSDTDKKESTW